ncbi:MAG: MOSC domain-containing protein [Spirulinaceae cyanobacterium SM2_1_0]|nr:MOSC domain-containing protein [Spirulinaceae cyanobacterium SM2_1_0]
MQVVELAIYPIKSCRGILLAEAAIAPTGFERDREFIITDAEGQFLTQRQLPQLAQIEVRCSGEDLILAAPAVSLKPLTLTPTLTGLEHPVQIFRDRTTAIDQGDAAAQWLQQALQLDTPVRLLRQTPKYVRPIDPHYATQPQQPVSFADGYPFLITNTASLADLNHRLQATYPQETLAVPMNRFRPNIAIASDIPFAEDEWQAVRIGEIIFDTVKPCERCVIPTTDQRSGQRSPLGEPLKTLASFRKVPQRGVLFGVNAIARCTGVIHVGDPVEVIAQRAPAA